MWLVVTRVHSRPRRVLEQLMLVESRLADLHSLSSFSIVIAAFGGRAQG